MQALNCRESHKNFDVVSNYNSPLQMTQLVEKAIRLGCDLAVDFNWASRNNDVFQLVQISQHLVDNLPLIELVEFLFDIQLPTLLFQLIHVPLGDVVARRQLPLALSLHLVGILRRIEMANLAPLEAMQMQKDFVIHLLTYDNPIECEINFTLTDYLILSLELPISVDGCAAHFSPLNTCIIICLSKLFYLTPFTLHPLVLCPTKDATFRHLTFSLNFHGYYLITLLSADDHCGGDDETMSALKSSRIVCASRRSLQAILHIWTSIAHINESRARTAINDNLFHVMQTSWLKHFATRNLIAQFLSIFDASHKK